jgi:protein farnesyltransferase/geranylgeranyltransferase type-1 subunit alpha
MKTEIEWLNPLAVKHQKNYQIWHHRQSVIDALGSWDGEHTFIGQVLELDSKNYHVWSYRQWAVSRFGLWDDVQEWQFTENMLDVDVRNNSAWNHRWYLAFGRPDGERLKDKAVVDREAEYAIEKIRLAPQNESPWNLLRALYEKASGPAALSWSKFAEFAKEFTGTDGEDVKSTHALDALAWALAEQQGHEEEACTALEQLATKWDPIRANYWRWRKSLINSGRQPHQGTVVA